MSAPFPRRPISAQAPKEASIESMGVPSRWPGVAFRKCVPEPWAGNTHAHTPAYVRYLSVRTKNMTKHTISTPVVAALASLPSRHALVAARRKHQARYQAGTGHNHEFEHQICCDI